MFTLVGFAQSQDTSGNLTQVNALADPHIAVINNNVVIPTLNQVIALFASGVGILRAQLRSPSLRRVVNYEISPTNTGAISPNASPQWVDLRGAPLPLDKDEQLQAFVAESTAGAEVEVVLAWLADGPIAPAKGNIFTVQATASITLVANAWTNGALTFDQTLPVGKYQIVGARYRGATAVAFRFVFVGGIWRPGGLGVTALNNLQPEAMRYGNFGVWGEFDFNTPPTVDFLGSGADTSETLSIDLIKTA